MKIIFIESNPFNLPIGRITECSDAVAESMLKQKLAVEYKRENNPIIQQKLYGTTNNNTK